MAYFTVILITILVSSLTFLSGFGLGTLLLPVFILFFPVNVAVAATAIVHLANNVFKAFLVGTKADMLAVLKFSIPAALAAVFGAWLLNRLAVIPPMTQYELMGYEFAVTPVRLLVAALMLGFALLELTPSSRELAFSPRLIPLGGALSGFFGGLTGHQGALRSAFLIRLGLDKETFIGTTILCAIIVDVSRLAMYGVTFFARDFHTLMRQGEAGLIVAGVAAAFLGVVLGYSFFRKATLGFIHQLIGGLLILYAVALGAGLI